MAMKNTTTNGRARHYPWSLDTRFTNLEIEQQIALMGELIERAIDQVHDLPSSALLFRPERVWFSIAQLMLHMSRSEYEQMRFLLPVAGLDEADPDVPRLDSGVLATLELGRINSTNPVPERLSDPVLLRETAHAVHREFTIPVCARIADADAKLEDRCSFSTPRDLVTHMNWHWSYHSGQIGLLRLQWGDNYVWTMAERT